MKIKIYINLCILFSCFYGNSQNLLTPHPEEDSLINVLAIASENNDRETEIKTLHKLGSFYCNNGYYQNSEKCFKQAISLANHGKFPQLSLSVLNDVVLLYEILGKFDKALQLSFAASRIARSLGNDDELSISLSNSANIYLDLELYEKALEYIDAAIEADKTGSFFVTNMMIKAYLLTTKGNANEALEYMDVALEKCEAENDSATLVVIYTGYGNILSEAKRNLESLNFHLQAYTVSSNLKNLQFLTIASVNLTTQFLELEKYDSAEIYAQRGLKWAEEINNPITIMDLYEMKSDILNHKKKYKEAYGYLRKHHELYKEIINSENHSKMNDLETKYKLEIKDKNIAANEREIELLQRKNQLSNYRIYALIALITFLGVFAILIYVTQKRKRKQEKILKEVKIKLTESELERTYLKNERLKSEVAYKNEELQELARNIIQKNELLNNVKTELKSSSAAKSKKLIQLIGTGLESNKEEFEQKIDDINTLFYKRIKEKYPALSQRDLKLLSLIKAGMSSKDISILQNINSKSVDMARYRLRKKLSLAKDVNMTSFLSNF